MLKGEITRPKMNNAMKVKFEVFGFSDGRRKSVRIEANSM